MIMSRQGGTGIGKKDGGLIFFFSANFVQLTNLCDYNSRASPANPWFYWSVLKKIKVYYH